MHSRLSLSSITKRFGTTVALREAHLTVRPGTIHALLGANGAGKTTLMHIAFGLLKPESGTIQIDGIPAHFSSPAQAILAGIGMVHQHFTLVPAMSVAENVALGGHGWFSLAAVSKRVRQLADRYNFAIDPTAKVESLSVGAQQRIEILKALARDAHILVLDEPTAVLSPIEAQQLLEHLRLYATEGGTVVLITHKLRDALKYADDITVLRNGETVLRTGADEANEQMLAESMLGSSGAGIEQSADATLVGTALSTSPTSSVSPSGKRSALPVLQLDHVEYVDDRHVTRVHDTSLQVYGGELVGIAAVDGNGQHELLRILAGRLAPTSGVVHLPRQVGFIPEDRHRDALVLDFSLTENIALANVGKRSGLLNWTATRATTELLLAKYDIQRVHPETAARTLSGGNQQRLVLSRELEGAGEGLVAENPTRGLDIHATRFVHRQLHEARDQGLAVVVYSSDLDEVLTLADRVLVLYNGSLREVPKDRNFVGLAMLGKDTDSTLASATSS